MYFDCVFELYLKIIQGGECNILHHILYFVPNNCTSCFKIVFNVTFMFCGLTAPLSIAAVMHCLVKATMTSQESCLSDLLILPVANSIEHSLTDAMVNFLPKYAIYRSQRFMGN